MNRVLVFCWREWRAQRGVLLGYCGLVFAALGLGFTIAPQHWWEQEGHRAMALSWFVAAGVLGLLMFVAPGLVRYEFGNGGKDDQFVRRLPGALLPSFGGKVLFLALATVTLPLLGLVAGEVCLGVLDQPWDDLFVHHGSGEVVVARQWLFVAMFYAALLIPWVWVLGAWLPGGRMAIGGTALLVLLLGLVVTAVLRQCPELENAIAWQHWLWLVAPLGVAVASVSWVRGRRGGGAMRSARFGIATMAVGLVPPAAWLAEAAHHYHHPDPQRLDDVYALGITPDLRYVLVGGREHATGMVPFRVDLTTGTPERLGGVRHWVRPVTLGAAYRDGGGVRFWQAGEDDHDDLFDLATGACTKVGQLDRGRLELPPDLRTAVAEEIFADTQWRAPGDRRVAVIGKELVIEQPDGTREIRPFPNESRGLLRPAGHGIYSLSNDHVYFDCEGREVEASRGGRWGVGHAVRDRWLFCPKPNATTRGGWHQLEPDGSSAPCEPLHEAKVLGLCDDDHVLACVTAVKGRAPRLFRYRPADRSVTEIEVPAGIAFQFVDVEHTLAGLGSLLPRDGAGRVWLRCTQTPAMRRLTRRDQDATLLVDPSSGAVRVRTWPTSTGRTRILGWPDRDTVLLVEGAAIVRVDIATGARTQLFPR